MHSASSTPNLSLLHSSSSLGRLYRDSRTGADSPYSAGGSRLSTLSDKYSLSPDPRDWGADLSPDLVEPDDALHNPDVKYEGPEDINRVALSRRGVANVGCLTVLSVGFLVLFIGYPILTYMNMSWPTDDSFNLGGDTNLTDIPPIAHLGPIDEDTPKDAYFRTSYRDGSTMKLVFSDEFNTDGRTFYPGEDPYWEAVDLHYWATNNLEWYDPAAVTTENGSLVITFSEKFTHDLDYEGGLISSWNKFCFTGGYIEASVQLPGLNNVVGMWPAIWTMGNLGRAGYGASLEGMWPYTYDSCDVGTTPNQTFHGLPYAATVGGDRSYNDALSVLPGQRLSRCTCNGESHPGPKHPDGTYVGRSAPEIDVFEAQVTSNPARGQVSQSGQWAPFNRAWMWDNSSANLIIGDPTISTLNHFVGSATQQATSVVTDTNQRCYELNEGCFSVYGFEYKPGKPSSFSLIVVVSFNEDTQGYDDAYISWFSEGKHTWTINAAGMGPDPAVEISARPVPQEPMYIIVNLGMSRNFGNIDFQHLTFPNQMRVDYIRVYQPENGINVGCDPPSFPTEAYINRYIEAYMNPNLTTWLADYGQTFPRNSFLESSSALTALDPGIQLAYNNSWVDTASCN